MTRKTLIISILLFLALIIFSLYTLANLPDLETYPIHWKAKGEADGFGNRKQVVTLLVMMPAIMLLILGLLYIIPKIEPLKDNFNKSLSAYNVVCLSVSAFFMVIGMVICFSYQGDLTAQKPLLLNTIIISLSLLIIMIGNYLGKVRQNFMFGIRTPWTLSSDLSWEKTHRLGGRLFVVAGVASLLALVMFRSIALYVHIALMSLATLVPIVYSFFIWKSDPLKRS